MIVTELRKVAFLQSRPLFASALQSGKIATRPRSLIHGTFIRSHHYKLHGSTALVTGGSRGLGLAIAKKLAGEGCSVVLCARNKDMLEKSVRELPIVIDKNTINDSIGNKSTSTRTKSESQNIQEHGYISCDLSDVDQLTSTFTFKSSSQDPIHSLLSKTNILVNCAGIMQTSLLHSTKPNQISQLLTTNLLGPIFLSQKMSKLMLRPSIKMKNRVIVNISSSLASRPIRGTTIYSATKGGLESFTKALSVELGPFGIRINAVRPGLVSDTNMGSDERVRSGFGNRIGEGDCGVGVVKSEDVTEAVMYFVGAKSVTGEILNVDNGYHL